MGHIEDKKIVAGIRKLGGFNDHEIFTAKVMSVNEDANTMDVEADEVTYHAVRLMAVSNGTKGVVLVPKKNSYILVGRVELTNNLVMLNCTELDKIKIVCEDVTFNGGKNNGLVMVKELTKKLNAVEDKLNDVIKKLQTVVVVLAPTGTYPFAPIFGSVIPLVKTQQSEIENEKIKH